MTSKAFCGAILLTTLFLLGCSGARPLRRSEESIRSSLLKRTPPGTSYEHVLAYLTKHWRTNLVIAGPPRGDWLGRGRAAGNPPSVSVATNVYVPLGDYYRFPLFEIGVVGIWLFDTNMQVTDVWVGKTVTGL